MPKTRMEVAREIVIDLLRENEAPQALLNAMTQLTLGQLLLLKEMIDNRIRVVSDWHIAGKQSPIK